MSENSFLDGTKTLAELAKDAGCCERAIRIFLDRANTPFVRVAGKRRYLIESVRAALASPDREPRRVGRPRKS